MGADPGIFVTAYKYLAKNFDKQTLDVQADRLKMAKTLRKEWENGGNPDFDFNDTDLDCYEDLLILGFAKRCKFCEQIYTKQETEDHGRDICESGA